MSAIRHQLVAGRRDGVADQRRAILLQFLGNPQLQIVGSPVVRDSWEHLDERLDRLIPPMRSGAISHVYVAAKPPREGTVVLKRFDPVGFAIHFADQAVLLRPAAREIDDLETAVAAAMSRLQHEIVFPWPTLQSDIDGRAP
jgi:hypothetical protein